MVSAAAPAAAASPAARWQRLFVSDVENVLGRGVHVDKASVKPGMIGRQFRQMQVLLRAHAGYLKGTMLYTGRAVDCAGSRALAHRWRIVRPDGTVLLDWGVARPSVSRVQWGGR